LTTLAIDPGRSTGLAWDRPDGGFETTVAPYPAAVYQVIQQLRPKRIILEVFQTGGRLNADARATIELCGGVRAAASFVGAEVILHTPKAREGMQEKAEDYLTTQIGSRGTTRKGAGVWTDHQADALAHLLAYLETGR
jgi:hypothetical protein